MMMKNHISRILRRGKEYLENGPRAIVDDLYNAQRYWKLSELENSGTLATGSISGRDFGYLSIVRLAGTDKKFFSKFKSNHEYREILEHVNRAQGSEYLNVIKKYGSTPERLIDFCRQDFCKPFRFSYPNFGRVSPTNLRYAKVTLDLVSLFGEMNNFDIAEIGVGYGGQFHALTTIVNPGSYTFFDLPEVCLLAQNYTQTFVKSKITPTLGNSEIVRESYDLIISNYAFSELNREVQDDYLKNVVLNSKRGYLIYNDIVESDIDTIKIEEFLRIIPGAVVLPEHPLTHPKNKLVVWGHSSLSHLILR